jgi:hypothetical protein
MKEFTQFISIVSEFGANDKIIKALILQWGGMTEEEGVAEGVGEGGTEYGDCVGKTDGGCADVVTLVVRKEGVDEPGAGHLSSSNILLPILNAASESPPGRGAKNIRISSHLASFFSPFL